MYILGIAAFYHDSAAALIRDGRVVAAAQEERFSRRKGDPDFPAQAIQYCLAEGGVTLDDVAKVVFYDKPFLKFERLIETYVAFAPRGYRAFRMAVPTWLRQKLFLKPLIADKLRALGAGAGIRERLLFTEHHVSHAASAYYASPFREAAVVTLDGVGEWATTSIGVGRGKDLAIHAEIHFPHSLGLLYSAFTAHAGFKVNSGEYKLMGLAPYGKPRYAQQIFDTLLDLKQDGSFKLDLSYFDYCTGLRMTNDRFDSLFGGPARGSGEPISQHHVDMAASVQAVIEEAILRIARTASDRWRIPNLCLAGGVALNCVANSKILRDGRFQRLWIQPAAGDAGGALGAALAAHHQYCSVGRAAPEGTDLMCGAFLGPAFSGEDIERRLRAMGARFRRSADEGSLIREVASALADGKIVGWFQGRMEFGPRALGARSILADPRSPGMQEILNSKIKRRESFRPFAPAVLREDVREWFEHDADSPYMLFTVDVRKHLNDPPATSVSGGFDRLPHPSSRIPAVTHVDDTARVQTVHVETNPRFHALLTAFKSLTGCPVLVNTSFNVRGEPIVCTPEDAFGCFLGTELDLLVVGDCLLLRGEQDTARHAFGARRFDPD